MGLGAISCRAEDHVGIISLCRPDIGNAFSSGEDGKGGTYREMISALRDFGADDEVGAIIIRVDGKNFCVGGNLSSFMEQIAHKNFIPKERVLTAQMPIEIRRCPKPVIAAMNGIAADGGSWIALASDFRFVTEKSRILLPFVKLGLSGDQVITICSRNL